MPKISISIAIKSILLFYEESKETKEGKNNKIEGNYLESLPVIKLHDTQKAIFKPQTWIFAESAMKADADVENITFFHNSVSEDCNYHPKEWSGSEKQMTPS